MVSVKVDGLAQEAPSGELLIDLLNRVGIKLPQVCYHPQLGPLQTCDTCMVQVDGKLARACGTTVDSTQEIVTKSAGVAAAQREAFDRILRNHLLYCTICDNNNGNCAVHNTTKMLAIDHQRIPFQAKPYPVDDTNPFYRYDPSQCILCGRCVAGRPDVFAWSQGATGPGAAAGLVDALRSALEGEAIAATGRG